MDRRFSQQSQMKIETLAAALLLIVLASLTVILIASTGSSYKKMVAASSDARSIRTALNFVATKIRQADTAGNVSVRQSDFGVQALVLSFPSGSQTYENWIFYYDGALREVLIPKGGVITPASCNKISLLDGFSARQEGKKIFVEAKNQSSRQLILSLRS